MIEKNKEDDKVDRFLKNVFSDNSYKRKEDIIEEEYEEGDFDIEGDLDF